MNRACRIASALSFAFLPVGLAGTAQAESCSKSRDYILANATDLPLKPQVYRELFRTCLATLEMSNVKDAFVLKGGAIAVIPRRDTVAGTASTLAQFCTRFPKGTLHFVGRKDIATVANLGRAVAFGSASPTPCQKITGN